MTNQIMKAPKMKNELRRGSVQEVHQRNRERAAIMRETFGVQFSIAGTNPLGVAEAIKLGLPGAGLPKASYSEIGIEPVTDPATVEKVKTELTRICKLSGYEMYASFTNLAFGTDLPFQTVFGVIKALRAADPYSVRFSVDRLGYPVYVKLVRKHP
jgi:hypothetical protein